jgi:hypothetical protein
MHRPAAARGGILTSQLAQPERSEAHSGDITSLPNEFSILQLARPILGQPTLFDIAMNC